MTSPNPPTPEEARDAIIEAARLAVDWWTRHETTQGKSLEECVSGAMFTFLAELDGTGNLPACDVVVLQSDEDGDTVGETRVSTMLHEYFYPRQAPRDLP